MVRRRWTAADAQELVREVMATVQRKTRLGVVNVEWISPASRGLGLSLAWQPDRIYIQCGGVRHPFDVISTSK